ncbi:MAG TPA: cupredoxin domain-containing protein [Candidatus Acidoferrales bacterium]|jgi:cytochrome c oxidase subunit 2|nr:cupredoxin domain-containing protein [Candidatus Acidoferrales bacterium]
MRFRSAILPAALIAVFAFAGFHAHAQENAASTPRVVEMTATNYEFMPAEVHVKVGETVRLSITAEDKEHGVRIKPVAGGSAPGTPAGLEIAASENCVKFKKHETGVIEFTARTPGTYEFECCKLCGFGHGKMKGQIIVDPS